MSEIYERAPTVHTAENSLNVFMTGFMEMDVKHAAISAHRNKKMLNHRNSRVNEASLFSVPWLEIAAEHAKH